MDDSTMDQVERLTRRRARVATVMGILLIILQAGREFHDPLRPVDYVNLAGWAVWVLALVVFIAFGSALWRGRAVRGYLNDESTIANRHQALSFGFWVMLAISGALFAFDFYEQIPAREALHITVTLGMAAVLLRFGTLERRALQG